MKIKHNTVKMENSANHSTSLEFTNFVTQVGLTLIQLQRTEYIIQASISVFDIAILSKDKRFKGFDSKSFLADTEEAKKTRKQTLGVLIDFLNTYASSLSLNEAELDKFLKDRNKFIHSFWREELSGGKSTNGWSPAALEFTSAFLADILKWQRVFQGLMALMVIAVKDRVTDTEASKEVLEKTAPFIKDFLSAIK
jgi:hypothetical protein